MKNYLLTTLQRGLRGDEGLLYNNESAWSLYNCLLSNLPVEKSFLIGLSAIYSSNLDRPKIEQEIQNEGINDYRLRKLLVRGFRKFPLLDNEAYFGLTFCKQNSNEPISSIYLGSNGVGKTSLYGALEWACLHKIYTGLNRGFTIEEEQIIYRTHIGLKPDSVDVLALSKEVCFNGNSKDTPYIPSAFYCSEYDINQLEKSNDSSEYILSQLGIDDMFKLIKMLRNVLKEQGNKNQLYKEYSEEIARLERMRDEQSALKDINIDDGADKEDIITKIEKLQQAINSFNGITQIITLSSICQVVKDIVRNTSIVYNALITLTKSEPILKPYKRLLETNPYKFKIESIKNRILQNASEPYKEWLKDIKRNAEAVSRYNEEIKDILEGTSTLEDLSRQINILDSQVEESKKFQNSLGDFENYDKWREDVNAIYKYLLKEYTNLIVMVNDVSGTVIPQLLEKWFEKDEHQLSTRVKVYLTDKTHGIDEIPKIDIELQVKEKRNQEDYQKTHAREFLNTFRFKLYCVALKVALSCCAQKIYKINFPIIIDDVFDSSDFHNRIEICSFIELISQSHKDVFPANEGYALQLIFFTQDDIIAESVYKGLRLSLKESQVKFSVLFDISEIIDSDKESVFNPAEGKYCELRKLEEIL